MIFSFPLPPTLNVLKIKCKPLNNKVTEYLSQKKKKKEKKKKVTEDKWVSVSSTGKVLDN